MAKKSKWLSVILRSLSTPPTPKSLLLLFLTALFVRFLFASAYILYFAPNFDGAELGRVAINLYEGRGMSSPLSSGSRPTAFFCPLVPMLWAQLMKFTGGPNRFLVGVIILLQTIPSAIAVVFYWLVTHRLLVRMPSLPQFMPFIVGLVFTVWPESLLRVTGTWYYVWQQAMIAALFLVGIIIYDRPSLRNGILLGAIAGLAGLVNPIPLPLFGVALLAVLIHWRSVRVLGITVLSGVTCLAITAPWTIRNYEAFGKIVPFRSNFGIELHQGNNPQGSIRQCASSLNPALQLEEYERFHSMGEIAYTEWAMWQAIKYIRSHPSTTALRILKRAYVMWSTDPTDAWPWHPSDRWWRKGTSRRWMLLRIVTIVTALVPLLVCLFGWWTRALSNVPYMWMFMSTFVFLPLPYYLTSANDAYSEMVRPWLALLAMVVLLRQTLDKGGSMENS